MATLPEDKKKGCAFGHIPLYWDKSFLLFAAADWLCGVGVGSTALGVAEVKFAPDCAAADEAAAALKPGEVLLLENLRYYPEEEGKPVGIEKEDPAYEAAKKEMKGRQKDFAKKLASYADCYVMDAFGTAHRKHASTAVIADYFDADNKMLGFLMEKEVAAAGSMATGLMAEAGLGKVSLTWETDEEDFADMLG